LDTIAYFNEKINAMRVCIVSEYPMSLMTGGLQVQALRTCEALNGLGGDITGELFDWSHTAVPADLYHFIGLPPYLTRITELVRQAGKPYVVTQLMGGIEGRFRLRTYAFRQFVSANVFGRRQKLDALLGAARIVVITQADKEAVQIVYRVEPGRIDVVPNGVAQEFFESKPTAWHERFGREPFVLCVGAIQARKGQLLLAQACNRLKLPLVLLGPVLPGEKNYAQQVEEAMQQNELLGGRWIQSLGNADSLLQSAYAACKVFALLSASETQPLSVMEAMAARRPILLRRAAYTEDRLFKHLPMIASPTVEAATAALKHLWEHDQPTALSEEYRWSAVARLLQTIYKKCGSQ
jgi:glycosyltransferase involved in cell wall biosynthesis